MEFYSFLTLCLQMQLTRAGDILVSNFNNAKNLQGTGSTIVKIDRTGKTSLFFQGHPGIGLTAALGLLNNDVIIVGNLPTSDGTMATVQPGSLFLISDKGQEIAELKDGNLIDGPWGLTIYEKDDKAHIFFSNVLNGTISRLDLRWTAAQHAYTLERLIRISSGYTHRLDQAALVLGPSGLAYDSSDDTLFIANSADNTIYAVTQAGATNSDRGIGHVIYQDNAHLHGPLDLLLAPNGHFLVANSDGSNVDPNQPSEIVEFTRDGKFVAQISVDPANGGAFGIALKATKGVVELAAVDDNANVLKIWTELLP